MGQSKDLQRCQGPDLRKAPVQKPDALQGEDRSAEQWLGDLLAFGKRIDAMLTSPPDAFSGDMAFKLRFARAHLLSFVDQLAELAAPPRTSHPPNPPNPPDSGTVAVEGAPRQKASTR